MDRALCSGTASARMPIHDSERREDMSSGKVPPAGLPNPASKGPEGDRCAETTLLPEEFAILMERMKTID